ncbi:MAG: hypothetical protein Q4A00_07900 [Flavobacteriaceae bacterium]|nr:hypothetical protein [Flavobacteriaceae bacterium]
MQEFLDKKISDLSVIETLKYAYLVSVCSRITMDLEEFCKTTGKDKRKVYKLLKSRAYPEKIIMGGYESLKQRKSPIFITEEVLNFIK